MTHHLPAVATQPQGAHRTPTPEGKAIAVGSWWRVRDAHDALAARITPVPAHGVVRAVVAVHRIDGLVHSVDLQRHPRQGSGTDRVLHDDFLARCTPEPNGAELRAREQADLLADLGAASARIAQGPDAEATARFLASTTASEDTHTQAPTHQLPAALTGGRDAAALSRAAQDAVALAGARVAWAKEQAEAMGAMAHTLTAYQTETAAVIQAQAHAQAAAARGTLENLATLTLFLGERQQVTTLVEGASAPTDAPLHFYQQMLYLDEELALAWPEDAGFTWATGIDHLGGLLSEHPDVVARMLPQPRSVAIARIRRHPRPLPDTPADWAAIFRTIEEREWDRALLILVRDGARVHMIEADADTAGAERLFPSRAEIDALYRERGWYGRDPIAITPDDLAYVESRAQHAQRALFYKRFLVLFWGLHARLGLFGPFMPGDANWFDPAVQDAYFRFVHDEEMGLAAPGPTAVAWMAAGVEGAGVGARIAVDTKVALDDGVLEGGYIDVDHRRLKGHPKDRFLVATMESDGLDRHVVIPMVEGRKTVRRRLRISEEGRVRAPRGLCLFDAPTVEAIDARLASRRDRVDYASVVPLLRWLRPQVAARQQALHSALGVDGATLSQPAWVAARTLAKDGAPSKVARLAKAYGEALEGAQGAAPALIDPSGRRHPLAPWRHPVLPDLPTALWGAGGQVCTALHPAPNGWVRTGALDTGLGADLGQALHRVDLPAWLDHATAQDDGEAIAATLDGRRPEDALALLKAFVDHNRAQKGARILPALCGWTVGVGLWSTPHRGMRLLALTAHHHPTALALAACGEEVVLAQLQRLYRDPVKALERAKERAAQGWWMALGPADVGHPPQPGLTLRWDEGPAGQAVPWTPEEEVARGTDGGMLLGGATERPSQFLFGGPGAKGYAERATGARFWIRAGARDWLAPRFHPGGWSQDGVAWYGA